MKKSNPDSKNQNNLIGFFPMLFKFKNFSNKDMSPLTRFTITNRVYFLEYKSSSRTSLYVYYFNNEKIRETFMVNAFALAKISHKILISTLNYSNSLLHKGQSEVKPLSVVQLQVRKGKLTYTVSHLSSLRDSTSDLKKLETQHLI